MVERENSEEEFWERWVVKRSRQGAFGVGVKDDMVEVERGEPLDGLTRWWVRRVVLLIVLEATFLELICMNAYELVEMKPKR